MPRQAGRQHERNVGAEAMETLSNLIGWRSEIRERLHAARVELDRQSTRLNRVLELCRSAQEARTGGRPGAATTRLFATDRVRLGDVEVIVPRQSVRDSRGTVRRFTPTEWQLLLFLLGNPDTVHSRSQLAAGAWGSGYDGRDTEVEVYISRLRRKLGSAAPLLETVRGAGYRFVLWGDGPAGEGLPVPAAATA
jgi:DNA-binding response OmpR family regulator